MFGFLIGTISLIALVKVLKGGHGYGGHWGHGRRWWLRGLFHRLETTPGQERVILESLEAMQKTASKLRDEGRQFGREVAQAFRGETLDHEPLKAGFLRHDAAFEEVQRELLVSLSKIHEALDPRQRAILADLLERVSAGHAFGAMGWGHGHHGWGGHGHRRCGGPRDELRFTTQSV